MTVFAVVIALTKDLADVEGDRKYNINTFATRIGVRGIAFLGELLTPQVSNLYAASSAVQPSIEWNVTSIHQRLASKSWCGF